MTFDISEILKEIGPAASIIFAAWIFMGFLQTRFDAAVGRYRLAVDEYRNGGLSARRQVSLRLDILTLKRRCNLMNAASTVGMVSAIILITALMAGEFALIFPSLPVLKLISAGAASLGFLLVIVASAIVLVEGTIIHWQIHNEIRDLDLVD